MDLDWSGLAPSCRLGPGLLCVSCPSDQWLPNAHSPPSERQEHKRTSPFSQARVKPLLTSPLLMEESHMTKPNTTGRWNIFYSSGRNLKVAWQRTWILRRVKIGNDNAFYHITKPSKMGSLTLPKVLHLYLTVVRVQNSSGPWLVMGESLFSFSSQILH